MKRLMLTIMVLFLTAGFASAKDFDITKKAGDYTVQIKMDRNPPVIGGNNIEIGVRAGGVEVADAVVALDYGMAAMPGMPAMNYRASTELKDKKYRARLNFSMSGPWFITMKIIRLGKTELVKLNVDVR